MGIWSGSQISKKEFDIFQGKYYTWQTSIPILAADPIRYFWWDVTNATRKIIFDPLRLFGTAGTIRLNFYINHDYSGGTEEFIYNREFNKIISRPPQSKIYIDPTDQGGGKGTMITPIDVGTQATNQSSGGGSIQSEDVVVVKVDQPFLVEAINYSGDNANLNVILTWKEEG